MRMDLRCLLRLVLQDDSPFCWPEGLFLFLFFATAWVLEGHPLPAPHLFLLDETSLLDLVIPKPPLLVHRLQPHLLLLARILPASNLLTDTALSLPLLNLFLFAFSRTSRLPGRRGGAGILRGRREVEDGHDGGFGAVPRGRILQSTAHLAALRAKPDLEVLLGGEDGRLRRRR